MTKFITLFTISFLSFVSFAWANPDLDRKSPTQEQIEEQELEAAYGVEVERDRIGGNATANTTRDRYGAGTVSVFQENTKTTRNLETNDTIGVELKLFEY